MYNKRKIVSYCINHKSIQFEVWTCFLDSFRERRDKKRAYEIFSLLFLCNCTNIFAKEIVRNFMNVIKFLQNNYKFYCTIHQTICSAEQSLSSKHIKIKNEKNLKLNSVWFLIINNFAGHKSKTGREVYYFRPPSNQ